MQFPPKALGSALLDTPPSGKSLTIGGPTVARLTSGGGRGPNLCLHAHLLQEAFPLLSGKDLIEHPVPLSAPISQRGNHGPEGKAQEGPLAPALLLGPY